MTQHLDNAKVMNSHICEVKMPKSTAQTSGLSRIIEDSSSPTTSDAYVGAGDTEFSDSESDDSSKDTKTKYCKYCEGPLPLIPSPKLLRMESELLPYSAPLSEFASRRNPTPMRTYPIYQHISYCQQHALEADLLPKACKMGWRTSLDWSATTMRILNLPIDLLATVLKDPVDNIVYNELRLAHPDLSTRHFTSLKGQMSVFDSKLSG